MQTDIGNFRALRKKAVAYYPSDQSQMNGMELFV